MKITIDKIASVTKNIGLQNEVEITTEIEVANGLCIVAEVLEDKEIYNELELVSGRLSILKKGDIIAVALGNRKALKGFVGKTPESLKAGDVIQVLNIGGVAGLCTSENVKQVGHALNIKVLGAVTDGKNLINVQDFTKFKSADHLASKVPLIIVSGTCMNVGKTTVACELIKHISDAGYNVFAAKLAGIAAQRDTDKMKDYAAKKAISFLDAGLTSTVQNDEQSVKVTKGAINYLSEGDPDFIVIEFGDGVFGEYGVMGILKDSEIQQNIVFHLGCAHDPMGAMKLSEVCESIGAPLSLIAGPVTDNEVGSDFVQNNIGIPAFNANTNPGKLFSYFSKLCLKK